MSIHVNVAAIERTIRVMNESGCFSMASWDTCLRWHAAKAAGMPVRHGPGADEEVAGFLGLSLGDAMEMFLATHWTRAEAVAALRELVP